MEILFRGGIKRGTSATTTNSRMVDGQVKNSSLVLSKMFPGRVNGHYRRNKIWDDIYCGWVPDGGAWLDCNKRVIVAFEAKYQGAAGNAIERHAKNLVIAYSKKAENSKYITFMSGAGAGKNEVMYNYAKTMMKCYNSVNSQDLNILHDSFLSFFVNPNGFDDEEIADIMWSALI